MKIPSFRVTALAAIALGVLFTSAVAFIFQDNIARFRINPREPYQLYKPPPRPSYGARGAWAIWPEDPGFGLADIFYIHSTTYASNDHWNAPINNAIADQRLRNVAAPNQAGPFSRLGAIYGPRYRQATRFTGFTHKFDGLAARQLAYSDVAQAFGQFLSDRPTDRPIIIVGYDQGGLHALGVLQQYFAGDEKLRRRLVAAYVIGAATPLSIFDDGLKTIPPCRAPENIRCVIAYTDIEPGFDNEKRRLRRRALIWTPDFALQSMTETPLLCVNPLSWTADSARRAKINHIGAASATGLRLNEKPPAISGAIGAQCVDGILAVDKPRQQFLRRARWFGGKWRTQDYNLFYHDLTVDAERRIANLNAALQEEERHNERFPDALDLPDSPVNNQP